MVLTLFIAFLMFVKGVIEMECLKFNLSSPFGFFRKHETRGIEFDSTFSHVHKVALKGLIGSVIGLEGYAIHNLRKRFGLTDTDFPEFYTALKDLRLSIVPITPNGDFLKHYETFTESQGFFGDKGHTLIVREQQLYRPHWEIYIDLSSVSPIIAEKIKYYFLNQLSVFIPYIGKNEHAATISEVSLFECTPVVAKEVKIESLFRAEDCANIDFNDTDDLDEEPTFFLQEKMPVSLNESTGRYVLETLYFTDIPVSIGCFYANKKHIIFI